ncbi:hypothetical protein [Actinomyces trachealis]|uniref:hypothetical protein n=1 Tax=Actinomyces trachealis TaxID=2763540 RepID=UPI0018C5AC8E|nr:hypothetical protein [Actinomyces trachealis]
MKNKVALRPALPTPPDTRRHPRRTTQVRRNLVVLAWVLAAALLVLLVLTGPLAAWGQWLPLHALLLGGIGSAITVWSAHFADTLLRRPALGGATLLDVRLYAHSLGAVLVLADITAGRDALTLTGVGVVVASALTGALAITLQYRRALAPRLAGLALHYAVALVLLAVGAALGYLTNWANDHGRAPLSDALYVAHTTTMLLGFVGTTVLGTLTVLWPTMLRTKMEPEAPRWARAGLPLLVAGTALLAAAGIWAPLAALGALAYLAGAAGVLVPAWRTAHRVPPTSFATASAAAAVAWFLACLLWVGVGVSVAGSGDADPGAARDVIHAVRVPLAAGFALQVLAAALSYLTPVMLGGGPATTRATNAIMDRAAAYRLVTANTCLLLAVLAPLPWPVRAVTGLVAGVCAAYVPVGMVLAWAEVRRRRRADVVVPSRPAADSPAPTDPEQKDARDE